MLHDLEKYLKQCCDYYIGGKDKLHMAAGLGLKVVRMKTSSSRLTLGKALKEQDGSMEFYIGLNYLF
jgi:hypothetical protein